MSVLRTDDDVEEYIFEISLEPKDNSLGIISRADELEIGEVHVSQSVSLLYQYSTGGCVWNTTPRFAEWIRGDTPLAVLVKGKSVVELGSGTGALAVMIHDLVRPRYIATDQRPLLKLCGKNCLALDNVEIREFDWEKHEFEGIDDDGVIVACDTVYNEYLINPFLDAIESVWSSCPNIRHAIVAVQLRDINVIELALKTFVQRLETVSCYEISPGFLALLLTQPLYNV